MQYKIIIIKRVVPMQKFALGCSNLADVQSDSKILFLNLK